MPNWRPSKFFCRTCQAWWGPVVHDGCPRGGGMVWVDLESFQASCNYCNLAWPLSGSIMRCPHGHYQQTEYIRSTIVLEAGDEVVGTDGEMVYVVRRSGALVIGFGEYPDQGYI